MGCWNKTCGISQFPIFSGQKTVTFVIIENERMSDRAETMPCYHNPYWDFVPIPIYGEYNDYGAQDDDAGQEYKYEILREFFGDKVVRIRDGSEYRKEIKNPFDDGESLGNSVHEQEFGIDTSGYGKKNGQNYVNISTIMIDRTLFETLSESRTLGDYRYDKSRAKTFTKNELCKTVENYQEYEAKLLSNADELTKFFGRIMWGDKFIKDNYDQNNWYNLNLALIRYFTAMSAGNSFLAKDFFNSVGSKMKPLDVVDSFMFYLLMTDLRKQIIPQSHEGSQADIESIHQKYINALQTMVNNRNEEFEDDEDETEQGE